VRDLFQRSLCKRRVLAEIDVSTDPGHEVAGTIDEVGAGVTPWKKGQRVGVLRHGGAMPGDLVAVQGIGGLGHLGVQFTSKFGYRVVAISRGREAGRLAKKLGANIYLDSSAADAAAELQKMGGAQVILATVPSAKPMTADCFVSRVGAARQDGRGWGHDGSAGSFAGPVDSGSRGIQGWASGIPTDSEDTLRFAEMTGVRPMIEKYPLGRVNEAFRRMVSGKAQFRVELTM
jgi:D-arabinose 1-dehydrogenase-like Zn-dependent alcohol dehydrogenase